MQTSAYIFHFCSLAWKSKAALLLQFTCPLCLSNINTEAEQSNPAICHQFVQL